MTLPDAGEGGVHKARSSLSGDECHTWRRRMTGIIVTQERAVLAKPVLGQGGRVLAIALLFVKTEVAPCCEFLA